ncbi:ribbon-helix-helix protein, CopG family [Planktothrix pseudagardhii]|uniref:Ribbon-helix-helix protein CopG domain-containing protein n=1 Tax=Planktothrix pseudagardhii TaxID=132604 RepID=A0A9W4CYM2_9CYAN|nr:ribbon-helix-helix protein, CopG family [Planktothrix pseudagardhii]CAD5919711.1 hypothetical protein NO713_00580 [Planktothrix pseudagardhii]
MSTNRKKRTPSTSRPASAISDKVKVTVSLTADSAQQIESLAKELGVSKSELFERLGKGELNLSTKTPETAPSTSSETVETANVESSDLSSETVALKQQVEEQANTIQQLQQQLTRISELEAQLAQTVDSATHEALKQEAEQQKQTITNLHHQLEQKITQTVDVEVYQALQKASEQQKSTIAQLQTQLNRIPELEQELAGKISAETHQTLQNELEQQRTIEAQLTQQIQALEKELNASNGSLAQLQMKQEKITELEVKLAHSISTESYSQLEHICATQKAQIATMEQKLASLVSSKTQQPGTTNTTVNYDALKTYLQEQDNLIDTLQKRVLELQGLACFGESQLSKWRYRTYNS